MRTGAESPSSSLHSTHGSRSTPPHPLPSDKQGPDPPPPPGHRAVASTPLALPGGYVTVSFHFRPPQPSKCLTRAGLAQGAIQHVKTAPGILERCRNHRLHPGPLDTCSWKGSIMGAMATASPLDGGTAAAAKSPQLCPTLCDPIDGSPPGSPVPGILQARTLEWVAISFSNA